MEDLSVSRCDDLRTLILDAIDRSTKIDLVTIVFGWVMARGDHHSEIEVEIAKGISKNWCRKRSWKEKDFHPGASEDLSAVSSELCGSMSRISPYDD